MGELTIEKLKTYSRGSVFVETGTENGVTIELASRFGFLTLHTIEINPRYVAKARKQFAADPRLHIHQGDSPDILRQLCPQLVEPATFWLDAHLTGGDSGVSDKYGACPLLDELAAIKLSPCKQHAILIDDCRELGINQWPTLQQVRQAIMDINPDYEITFVDGYWNQHPNDILVATISA